MSKKTVWELIAKKLSGEASAEELVELENLMRENPDMHYPMQTVADLWHHATPDTEDAHHAFGAHAERMKQMGIDIDPSPAYPFTVEEKVSRKSKYFALSVAAVAILLIGFFSRTALSSHHSKVDTAALADKSEISTKYGSRTKLLLPDGTQVWLNSGSKLSYDKTYGNGLREVSLSGEAYFDVVKNPSLPFVIHTSSIDIKVLGTAFNVKSFPGEKNTETSLIRGSIEVTLRNNPAEKIILKPNQKLVTANEDLIKDSAKTADTNTDKPKSLSAREPVHQEPLVLVSHLTYQPSDSTVIETSWMENKLIFRSETFEDVAVKMERWYGISVRFASEDIKPRRLTGVFENESLQQALKALQFITPFTYKINKNEVIIASK